MKHVNGKAATLVVAALIAAESAFAAGNVRAALVENVIPKMPYTGHISLLTVAKAMGPATGALGVTSVTLTNFDSAPQQVFLFQPVYGSGGTSCDGPILGGGAPSMTVYVQPFSTLHLTYPSPLAFGADGHACVAAQVTTVLHGGSVAVDVNGFVN